jgi:cytochrome c556
MTPMRLAPALLISAAAVLTLGAAPAAPPPTPEQFIAARQAGLDMSVFVTGSLRNAAKAGGDVTKQGYATTVLNRWAHVLPTLFPAGTGEGQTALKTQAKAAVWSDRAGFLAKAANYAAATEKLKALAAAGDTPGFQAQVAEVDKACDACHAIYKEPPPQ